MSRSPERASSLFHDPTGPFIAKDAYVFVIDTNGVELINGAFAVFEGRRLLDFKDTNGKEPIREMLRVVETHGSGWVDLVVRDEIEAALKDNSAWLEGYWYKPGDNKPARKQTYVRKLQSGADTYVVGSGVYME